ncbi:hypothetical protein JIN84_20265 [Luteolibacter yonseiensis]|uniref:PEP-CTERM sorting domain-containing protein n=1 Tax=Luteolibacter yonseiensis TaxID=1144680 RepID=A0A934R3Z3_9BACT|nr:hypothetical protein [Luteolibacter yonseiensis]MBK1817968.1 hypothetical protein [Luteolibacter yonseiensis]
MKINTATCLLTALMAAAQVNAASVAPTYSMIVSTSEGVGAFNSSLSGTSVQTFDNLLGVRENVVWEGVGTFDKLNVINPNVYGGAPSASSPNGTPYAVEGIGQIGVTTLKLNQATSYFGLYWSAGDASNDMKFYNNGVLVADFTTANLMDLLPDSYYGNPIQSGDNVGGNGHEPYGFINFIGDANTSWDTIVFTNGHGSGFEADNYTVRANGWNPGQDGGLPGTPLLFLESTDGEQTVSTIDNATLNGDKLVLDLTGPNGAKSTLDFAPSAPAAPAPPITIIAAFASVIALKGLRRKTAA